jgi:DNA-binding FrmR family transcriptional regulator
MASEKPTNKIIKGANHRNLLPKLNRIEGQVGGVKKMIDDKRYCPEIIQQVRATRKALASVEASLIESHIRCCVQKTFAGHSEKAKKEKLEEVILLFKNSINQGMDI